MRGHNTPREATFTSSYPQRSAPFHRAESVLSSPPARTRPSSFGDSEDERKALMDLGATECRAEATLATPGEAKASCRGGEPDQDRVDSPGEGCGRVSV